MRTTRRQRFATVALLLACVGACSAEQDSAGNPAAASSSAANSPAEVPTGGGQRSAPRSPSPEQLTPQRSTLCAIPAGSYRSFFPGKDEPDVVDVMAFELEEHAVTNAQFLLFVRAHPKWRRSAAKALFVDANYLRHWSSDFGFSIELADCPVINVSWFAARAYARWIGRRLPTLQEWEYVALASETAANGSKESGHAQRILEWYGKGPSQHQDPVKSTFRNYYAVHDMHGLVWEWVENFNTALVTGESRGDTGLERTLFCGAGSIGSANPEDYASFMRFAFRSSLKARYTTKKLGFRCAVDGGDQAAAEAGGR